MRLILLTLLSLCLPVTALATDGVLEINQTCALQTGCFEGDDPGFPVTIINPGSYRLTSSLDLSAEGVNVSGVAVSAPAVTIDLRGFQIAGPTSCSGSGTSISCNPSSTGVGSAGVQFTINATAGVVEDGIVRNMTNFGILSQATGLRVQDVTAIQNGRDGITGGQGSLVVNSVAIENGQDGIDVNTGSVVDGVTAIGNGSNGIRGQGTASVVTRTSVRNNGMRGFFLGLQYKFGENNVSSANDLICTDRRRYYMSVSRTTGDGPLGLCRTGFHFASMWELINPSALAYDTWLGEVRDDSGTGPPGYDLAWARNGYQSNGSSIRGNCGDWTNGTSGKGNALKLDTSSGDAQPIWKSEFRDCFDLFPAWCVEDTHE
jgi:hypothetical protein